MHRLPLALFVVIFVACASVSTKSSNDAISKPIEFALDGFASEGAMILAEARGHFFDGEQAHLDVDVFFKIGRTNATIPQKNVLAFSEPNGLGMQYTLDGLHLVSKLIDLGLFNRRAIDRNSVLGPDDIQWVVEHVTNVRVVAIRE